MIFLFIKQSAEVPWLCRWMTGHDVLLASIVRASDDVVNDKQSWNSTPALRVWLCKL